MRYLSLFSGVEAATVAWHPLGWKPVAFAEIAPFPCAVLDHHYPGVPNLGSVTGITDERIAALGPIDVVVGGSPCQDLSVAGKRRGLDGERSSLFHEQIRIFDAARLFCGARWLVWENVPGAFSINQGRDFAVVAGAMAGCDLDVPEDGWGTEGVALGDNGLVEWCVLDAQWFGVAQRRRRVFSVLDVGNWANRPPILLERDSLRGDFAPSRKAGESVAGGVEIGPGGGRLTDLNPTLDTRAKDGPIRNQLAGAVMQQTVGTLCAADGKGKNGQDAYDGKIFAVAHTLRGEGFDASEDGTGRGTPLVPVGGIKYAHYSHDYAHDRITDPAGVNPALTKEAHASGNLNVAVPVADTLYNKGIVTLKEGNARTQETYPGTLLRTLQKEVGEEAFAKWGLGILDSLQQAEVLRQALHGLSIRPASFSRSWVVCCALGFPVYGSGWLLQSLREAGCERCSSQGWEPSEQLSGELGAYLSELSRPGAQAARLMRDLWFASEGVGLLQQALLAVQEVGRSAGHKGQSVLRGSEGRRAETPEAVPSAGMQCEVSRERVLHQACAAGKARDSREGATEQERSGKGRVGETPFAVRRLTVEECEFLQGFPRGYTNIPVGKKMAADGPRYKALGNSMAVPVMRWIGERIDRVSKAQEAPR